MCGTNCTHQEIRSTLIEQSEEEKAVWKEEIEKRSAADALLHVVADQSI
jgi:hypothetical protein